MGAANDARQQPTEPFQLTRALEQPRALFRRADGWRWHLFLPILNPATTDSKCRARIVGPRVRRSDPLRRLLGPATRNLRGLPRALAAVRGARLRLGLGVRPLHADRGRPRRAVLRRSHDDGGDGGAHNARARRDPRDPRHLSGAPAERTPPPASAPAPAAGGTPARATTTSPPPTPPAPPPPCEEVGRAPAEIRKSLTFRAILAEDEAALRERRRELAPTL